MDSNQDIFLKFVEDIASKPNTKLLTKEHHVKVCQFLANGPPDHADEYDRQKTYDLRSKINKKRYKLISTDPTDLSSKKERALVVPQPDRGPLDMPAQSMMGSYMRVVTPDEIYGILEDVHNGGHAGSRALWHKVKDLYYGITEDICKFFTHLCTECAGKRAQKESPPLKPISAVGFMTRGQIDLVDFSKENEEFNWMGHYMDHFTKFHFLWAQKSKTAEETATCLVNNVFSVVGLPRILQHDNGTEFCNSTMEAVLEQWPGKVVVIRGRPRHPATQGLVEKGNDTAKKAIQKLQANCKDAESFKKKWFYWLPTVQYELNCNRQASTKMTPYEVVFGQMPNYTDPILTKNATSSKTYNEEDLDIELQRSFGLTEEAERRLSSEVVASTSSASTEPSSLSTSTMTMSSSLLLNSKRDYCTLSDLVAAMQKPEGSAERLQENITQHGLESVGNIPADGNCFFHAVSHQLELLGQAQQSASQLRSAVMDFLRQTPQIQGPDGEVDFAAAHDDWPGYLDKMAKDFEWADAHIVFAMAKMLRIDILVIMSSPGSSFDDTRHWIVGQPNFSGTPIMLGHEWEYHYISLAILAQSSSSTQPPTTSPAPSLGCAPPQTLPPSTDHDGKKKVPKLGTSKNHVAIRQKCLENTLEARNAMVQSYNRRRTIANQYRVGDGVTVKVPGINKAGKTGKRRLFGRIVKVGRNNNTYRVRTQNYLIKGPLDAGTLEIYKGAINFKTDEWEKLEQLPIKKVADVEAMSQESSSTPAPLTALPAQSSSSTQPPTTPPAPSLGYAPPQTLPPSIDHDGKKTVKQTTAAPVFKRQRSSGGTKSQEVAPANNKSSSTGLSSEDEESKYWNLFKKNLQEQVLDFIKESTELKAYIKQIALGKVASQRHDMFNTNIQKLKNMNNSGFMQNEDNGFDDDDLIIEIYDTMSKIEVNLQKHSTFHHPPVDYIYLVCVPEAILFAIEKVCHVDEEEAKLWFHRVNQLDEELNFTNQYIQMQSSICAYCGVTITCPEALVIHQVNHTGTRIKGTNDGATVLGRKKARTAVTKKNIRACFKTKYTGKLLQRPKYALAKFGSQLVLDSDVTSAGCFAEMSYKMMDLLVKHIVQEYNNRNHMKVRIISCDEAKKIFTSGSSKNDAAHVQQLIRDSTDTIVCCVKRDHSWDPIIINPEEKNILMVCVDEAIRKDYTGKYSIYEGGNLFHWVYYQAWIRVMNDDDWDQKLTKHPALTISQQKIAIVCLMWLSDLLQYGFISDNVEDITHERIANAIETFVEELLATSDPMNDLCRICGENIDSTEYIQCTRCSNMNFHNDCANQYRRHFEDSEFVCKFCRL